MIDQGLLLHLLELPTAGPLEAPDARNALCEAQGAYAVAAAEIGFTTVHHAPPDAAALDRDDVPAIVREAVFAAPDFLRRQPSLVLRLGPARPVADTVMCNVHLDTVAGDEPVGFDGARFTGRGAVDAKGPAVALLAGVREAVERDPALPDDVTVLIQAVAGEEGGAMGVFGTRPLVGRGLVGRLNVFCEPTGLRYLPRATAAMTASIEVAGRDAIDDRPEAGHNATVLLGFLAQHLAARLPEWAAGGRVCVAGLHTGTLHNRVYGSGRLLLNIAYDDAETGGRLEAALASALSAGVHQFAERFGDVPGLALTAAEAPAVTRLRWTKRGLPALAASDPWAEELLHEAGIPRWPDDEPAFTCDAIWMHGVPGTFTLIYGPGDLEANRAHAAGEHVNLAELEAFAGGIAGILTAFARARREAAQ